MKVLYKQPTSALTKGEVYVVLAKTLTQFYIQPSQPPLMPMWYACSDFEILSETCPMSWVETHINHTRYWIPNSWNYPDFFDNLECMNAQHDATQADIHKAMSLFRIEARKIYQAEGWSPIAEHPSHEYFEFLLAAYVLTGNIMDIDVINNVIYKETFMASLINDLMDRGLYIDEFLDAIDGTLNETDGKAVNKWDALFFKTAPLLNLTVPDQNQAEWIIDRYMNDWDEQGAYDLPDFLLFKIFKDSYWVYRNQLRNLLSTSGGIAATKADLPNT